MQEKLSGPQVLKHSFEVNAIALDGDAFDNESSVDELLERFGVGDFCDTNWFLVLRKDSEENRSAREFCGGTELFFDAKKLVVFCDAIGPGSGACFDLARASGDGEIGDESVFGFAAAMRNDGVVPGFAGEFDGVNGLRDATDLIELDEDCVGNSFVDAAREPLGVGHKEIIADELDSLLT